MSKILDQYGRPFKKSDLEKEIVTGKVSYLHDMFSSTQNLNPTKLSQILKAAESGSTHAYLTMAEEIEEKDTHYMSVMGTRKRAVSQLEITVSAASDSPEDERNAELIRSWLERDQLEDEIFDIMDAVGKGYSVTEIIWDTSQKLWMPSSLEYCDPRSFKIDSDGKTILRLHDNGYETSPLEKYKFITHTHKAKSGLKIRSGVAKACAWMFLFKNFAVKDWVIFCEAYGQPSRVGKYGPGATKEDRNILMKAVSNIGSDAAAIIPESMTIDFVEGKDTKSSAEVFEKLARFCDEQMSKAVLGQTTTTDAIAGGHAVSKEHNDVRGDIQGSDAKQVSSTFNRDLVPAMIDVNYGPQKQYPRIHIGRQEQIDTEAEAKTAKIAVEMGMKVSESKLRKRLSLPEPENDKDILGYKSSDDDKDEKKETASSQRHDIHCCSTAKKDNIDELADAALSDYEELIVPAISQIEEVLKASKSYEEAFEKMAELAPDLNMSDLQTMMEQANFFARVAGRNEVDL